MPFGYHYHFVGITQSNEKHIVLREHTILNSFFPAFIIIIIIIIRQYQVPDAGVQFVCPSWLTP
jgi:hypothetical protein